MSTKRPNSEAAVLEQYRVSLENVEKQPTIATIMSEFGYTPEVIAQGKGVYLETQQTFDANRTEDDETSAAYKFFTDQKEKLADLYSNHRKKAKVIFRNEPVIMEQLGITGRIPHAHVKWMDTVKTFYAVARNNEALQSRLARLKVTPKELNEGASLITETETARAEYLREVGESQDATKQKDAAFAKLDDWMSEFYAVAKIALDDHPQLMESLGKPIKS
ncbi:hypothetical protein [Sunxiuqinia indica]|uniref:hypothetical protein n=1 Tax=Sunxiuqinia indica TaxID=2692584 RepID=UPI00135A0D2E|nr:hypothetical protein [Sunxiuqinia indica]